jgi:epoxyqueuosine reductase
MEPEILKVLNQRGYQARLVPIPHLCDLRDEIESRRSDGSLDPEFYQECLTLFDFNLPESLPDARSLIVVAAKQSQIRFAFTWKGVRREFTVPPTYVRSGETNTRVETALKEMLEPAGYRVAEAVVPKKLTAVRSGLAQYGRNNITYVPGFGSFHRLVAYYSDVACDQDTWQEPRMMARCETCSACLKGCPTGAISPDRFLIRAERCIVFHNEHPNPIPFPAWLDPSWHNCLVGCMLCQIPCPEDVDCLEWIEDGAEFSSEETSMLVEGLPVEDFPASMTEKLNRSELAHLLDVFPRNLIALLDRPENG